MDGTGGIDGGTGVAGGSRAAAAAAAQRRARRLRGARIARLLAPAAWRLGGFASSEVVVASGSRRRRPSAVVAACDPPPDGVLAAAPLLVVELDPAVPPGDWLAAGAKAVWVPAPGGARCLAAGGTDVSVAVGGVVRVPGCPGLALPARELAAGTARPALRWPDRVR